MIFTAMESLRRVLLCRSLLLWSDSLFRLLKIFEFWTGPNQPRNSLMIKDTAMILALLLFSSLIFCKLIQSRTYSCRVKWPWSQFWGYLFLLLTTKTFPIPRRNTSDLLRICDKKFLEKIHHCSFSRLRKKFQQR
jgi:hypothetical protein